MAITEAIIDHYQQHGYVIMENLLTAKELNAARTDIEQMIPGWLDYAADNGAQLPTGWDEVTRSRRNTRFPFPGEGLNAVTLHPDLLALASAVTAWDDLYCEQADLSYKCKGHFGDREQTMHMDYGNHTLVYPPANPRYWQTAFLIYYTDVELGSAPTAVCSWEHYRDEMHFPMGYSREQRSALYDNEIKVVVPAGSVLAYSMRTFHRGTAFSEDTARVSQFVTFAPRDCKWMGIVGWSEQAIRPEFNKWIVSASPAERELFGFPGAGDPYWTEETLAGVSARYPGMDMSPYIP